MTDTLAALKAEQQTAVMESVRIHLTRAWAELKAINMGRFRQGGKDWRMSIPVRRDDSDMVFGDALVSLEDLLAVAEGLEREREDARHKLSIAEIGLGFPIVANHIKRHETLAAENAELTAKLDAAEARLGRLREARQPLHPCPKGTTWEAAEAHFRSYINGPGEIAHRAIVAALAQDDAPQGGSE